MAKEPFAAKLTSIWIGGFFFWFLKGFNGKLNNQFSEKYESRNIWTGYTLSLIVACTVLYILYKR
ncbi:hypothetical protein [Solitalea canadensis]|uniref:Uncharacterized protein n=1 Tax=Solitalea canadensis (strain ATCC 29591 / DSM 3403 / JCM 21819 / LMG 8368 / NBRC 15130 / NCIMB 12057 / USAM 9D) TaxID=929556 RepID=H8KLU1_SOLCM|nr:hypothetical protein [Solitalea canadensis]AFD08669.1 hypothetical protein Solca_3665 [Solitalea canadensis DSM 3403]